MRTQKKTILALALASVAFALGAQTIQAPAGSTDSGSRSVVGMDVSGLQSQINSVANTANAAYWYGTNGYNLANTANNTANAAYWYGTNGYNLANTAYNTANAAYNTANNAYNYATSGWTTGKVVSRGTALVYSVGGPENLAGVCVVGLASGGSGFQVASTDCPAGTGFILTDMTAGAQMP